MNRRWRTPLDAARGQPTRSARRAGRQLPTRTLAGPSTTASLKIESIPSAAELSARADHRDLVELSNPPDMLDDPEPPPPIAALPRAMARATAAMLTLLEAEGLSAEGASGELAGTGIGTKIYRGPARVATDADNVLDRLEPGDVLIAPFTGPSYNSILPILGGLVVEAGGPMCHAAIVAREFGLPAVIGASGAMSLIADGAIVEVDPLEGVVRVVT